MRTILTATLCMATAMTLAAQKNVVKEAENAMKSGKSFEEVVTIITPATENPETAQSAQTYYIPGQAGIKQYNDLLVKRQMNMGFPEDGPYTMAKALVGAYAYFLKALPLDSIPDEKGKVKPKYSKSIVNEIVGHYSDFNDAAVDFWNAKDYQGAYDAWGIYLDIPNTPAFQIKELKVVPDTILADTYFNRALAAWQLDQNQNAIDAFKQAIAKGYDKKGIYEYGVAVAQGAKDYDALLYFATEGNNLYGKDDTQFINYIINYYLQTEKYDEAIVYLNDAIAAKPDNAQYYALRGIIYDNMEKSQEARADYTKAHELDAENPLALFYLGRSIAAEAGKMSDDYTKPDFDQFKERELAPRYRQAIDLLREAYRVDKNNRTEVLKLLDVIYYQLNDENGLEWVKEQRMNDE